MHHYLFLFLAVFTLIACSDGAADTDTDADPQGATTIYFTRHAEKGSGDDPNLTAAGQERAERLASLLSGKKVAAVYATDRRRTQQTAAPLAKARGLQVRTYDIGGDAAALTDGWVKQHRGQTILVVGHSNTVPDLLNALTGKREYGDIPGGEFSRLYKVMVNGRGRVKVREMSSGK